MAKRKTEEQIIGVLKESEAGMKTSELCRKHGISEGTFYKWKDKFGGRSCQLLGCKLSPGPMALYAVANS